MILEQIIIEIQEAIIKGNVTAGRELTKSAIDRGVLPELIMREGLEPAMKRVGTQFREYRMNIPEVLIASRALHAGLRILKSLSSKNSTDSKGRVVVGTVAGDLHDIGKNMVAMMLEWSGYQVIDIGIDVPATEFVTAVKKYRPDILAMSALLTTSMAEFQEVINQLKKKNLRKGLKIIVGGTPVTPKFAQAVGADGFASDAWKTVNVVEMLLKS